MKTNHAVWLAVLSGVSLTGLSQAQRLERPSRLLAEATRLSLESVAPLIRPGECVVQFELGPVRSYALWLDATRTEPERVDLTGVPGNLEGDVDAWRAWIAEPTERDRPQKLAASHALFEGLFPAELWRELRSRSRVIVIPDGALHRLAFDSLVVAMPRPRQAERYWVDAGPAVSVSPDLVHFAWARQHAAAIAHSGVAARGCVAVTVPERTAEAQEIVRAFGPDGNVVLAGAGATLGRVRSASVASRNVLFDAPHRSFPRRNNEVSLEGDDVVELSDVMLNWRFEGTELVFLCGDSTNIARTRNDGRPIALPYAFAYAGVPSVVGTVTDVDPATSSAFARELLVRRSGGAAVADAFLAAKRAMRERHPAPAHWAPFVLLGE